MVNNNLAPKTEWRRQEQACGCFQQRLYVDGRETPYFIDEAAHLSHRTHGCKYGLMGSGMGALITSARTPYRIAAILASANRIESLKHRAEQSAMSAA